MSQTITIKCENCDAVLEAMRQLNINIERLIKILSASSNGKPSKQKDRSDHSGDHELLNFTQFAQRINRSRQTIYKWNRSERFPPGSLVIGPSGHFLVDWEVYKNKAYEVVNYR